MSDKIDFRTKHVAVQEAKIVFYQPDREDIHETSSEFELLVKRKSQELSNEIMLRSLYNASGFQLETERQLKEVCRNPDCRNIFKYSDYNEAITQCKADHSINVQLEMLTVGLLWCLVLPKQYEKTFGQIDLNNVGRTLVVYELNEISVVNQVTEKEKPK